MASRKLSARAVTRAPDGPEPAVSASGPTKRYGDVVALDDVTLSVEAGEVFGFLGPNGAGKSTTIRLLLGPARPTSGQARIFGAPPLTWWRRTRTSPMFRRTWRCGPG